MKTLHFGNKQLNVWNDSVFTDSNLDVLYNSVINALHTPTADIDIDVRIDKCRSMKVEELIVTIQESITELLPAAANTGYHETELNIYITCDHVSKKIRFRSWYSLCDSIYFNKKPFDTTIVELEKVEDVCQYITAAMENRIKITKDWYIALQNIINTNMISTLGIIDNINATCWSNNFTITGKTEVNNNSGNVILQLKVGYNDGETVWYETCEVEYNGSTYTVFNLPGCSIPCKPVFNTVDSLTTYLRSALDMIYKMTHLRHSVIQLSRQYSPKKD